MRTAGLPRPPDDSPGTVQQRGDVAGGWAAAEVTVEATYTTPQETGKPPGLLAAAQHPGPRSMRAPGDAQGNLALESAMDELAYARGADPLELRLHHGSQQ